LGVELAEGSGELARPGWREVGRRAQVLGRALDAHAMGKVVGCLGRLEIEWIRQGVEGPGGVGGGAAEGVVGSVGLRHRVIVIVGGGGGGGRGGEERRPLSLAEEREPSSDELGPIGVLGGQRGQDEGIEGEEDFPRGRVAGLGECGDWAEGAAVVALAGLGHRRVSDGKAAAEETGHVIGELRAKGTDGSFHGC
jgi:hypothetical protein